MGGLRSLLVVLALLLGIAPALATDPLTGRGATPQSETAAPFASGVVLRLAQAQRRLNDAISAAFREVRDGGSRGAIAAILGLAFLYGVLHAIGPGHGKAVVASYFVANRARWTGGIAMGSLISLIQGATAIVLVGLLAVVLQWRQLDVLNRATLVEFVSYGLIALLGIVMLWRGIAGHGHGAAHDHDHDHDGMPSGGSAALRGRLVLAAGLTPCASAIIILLFALANQALLIGIVAVASLSLGMAITVSAIGVASVLGRRALVGVLDRVGLQSHRLEQGLSILGAVVIVAASGLMMAGAWARL
jgi:ABC-type nickel/cobalt efflux system permease component RcnA